MGVAATLPELSEWTLVIFFGMCIIVMVMIILIISTHSSENNGFGSSTKPEQKVSQTSERS